MNGRLEGVNPDLQEKVEQILRAMLILGFPMFVVSGRRSDAEQVALYAKGRSAPGKVVTNLDGVKRKSKHQLGLAVDCAFVDDPATRKVETWDEKQPWELYGLMAEKLGLVWGGRWKRLVDRPHVELQEEE